MTDGLRGNKLPLSWGLESDYRPVLSAPQKVDASITHRGFKGARALTMHGVWKGAMKCAFDSDSPMEPHSRNGFFVKFELLRANPSQLRSGWGWGWPAHPPRPFPGWTQAGRCSIFLWAGSMSCSLWPGAAGNRIRSYYPSKLFLPFPHLDAAFLQLSWAGLASLQGD